MILFSRFSIPNFRLSTYNYRFSIFVLWLLIFNFQLIFISECLKFFYFGSRTFLYILLMIVNFWIFDSLLSSFDYQLLNLHFWSFAFYFWLSKSTLNYKFTNVTYLLFLIIWNIIVKIFNSVWLRKSSYLDTYQDRYAQYTLK